MKASAMQKAAAKMILEDDLGDKLDPVEEDESSTPQLEAIPSQVRMGLSKEQKARLDEDEEIKNGAASQRPQDIAFPTTLSRHVSLPGAFRVRGIEEPGPPSRQTSAPPSVPYGINSDPVLPDTHLVSARLVCEDGDCNDDESEFSQRTASVSSSMMYDLKAEPIQAERLNWSPSRCQFLLLITMVVIFLSVSISLVVIMTEDRTDQFSDLLPGHNKTSNRKCLNNIFRDGDLEPVVATNFVTWGTRPTENGAFCLQEPPRAYIDCGKRTHLKVLKTYNTSCTMEANTRGDERGNANELVCKGPKPGATATVLFECAQEQVHAGAIRGLVRLSQEQVVESEECQASLQDMTFVSAGLFCKEKKLGKAIYPVTADTCVNGTAFQESRGKSNGGDETAGAGRVIDTCRDEHEDDSILLQVKANHPKQAKSGVLDNCVVARGCEASLGELRIDFQV